MKTEPQPNHDVKMPTAAGDGCWLQCLVRLLDTAIKSHKILTDVNLVNKYVRNGWYLDDLKTKYWSTKNGGFDSQFLYHLKNNSWIFRFVSERINRHVLERTVRIWRWASSSNIEQNPTVTKPALYDIIRRRVRFILSKTSEFCNVHIINNCKQPNVES